MDDLIGRKAVEKAIKDYFKMIIDETDDDVDYVLDYNKNLCDTLDEIPVAYDVDKVVEKLKKMSGIQFDGQNESYQLDWCISTSKAIEIIKGGKIDE